MKRQNAFKKASRLSNVKCEEELKIDYEAAYHLQSHVFDLISLAILPQENECPPGVYDKQPGPFHFRTIYESRVPSWETKAVGEVPDETLPHIKCMISIAGVEDGNSKALLRGELIIILSIIEQCLRNERLCTHIDVPVLLFTFRDSMARAIEANLEGGQLVLRVTKWYDFKQEAEDFTLSFFFAR